MKNRILTTAAMAVWTLGVWNTAALAQHGGHGGGGGGSAPSMPSMPTVHAGKVKGKIVELQDNSITVEGRQKGKSVRTTYTIDRQTKTKGKLAVGGEVVVKYREEHGVQTATSVEAAKSKRTAG